MVLRELQNKSSVMEKSVDCKACSSHFFFFNKVFFLRRYSWESTAGNVTVQCSLGLPVFHHEGILRTSEQTRPKVKASTFSEANYRLRDYFHCDPLIPISTNVGRKTALSEKSREKHPECNVSSRAGWLTDFR